MIKKEYKLICETTNKTLSDDVTRHLNDGWELYDKPFVVEALFFQAIIREFISNSKKKR